MHYALPIKKIIVHWEKKLCKLIYNRKKAAEITHLTVQRLFECILKHTQDSIGKG